MRTQCVGKRTTKNKNKQIQSSQMKRKLARTKCWQKNKPTNKNENKQKFIVFTNETQPCTHNVLVKEQTKTETKRTNKHTTIKSKTNQQTTTKTPTRSSIDAPSPFGSKTFPVSFRLPPLLLRLLFRLRLRLLLLLLLLLSPPPLHPPSSSSPSLFVCCCFIAKRILP